MKKNSKIMKNYQKGKKNLKLHEKYEFIFKTEISWAISFEKTV